MMPNQRIAHDHDGRPGPVQPQTTGRAGRWITDWRTEDAGFWERTGARVARRNLILSVFSEHVGFSVWSLWSVFVLFLTPCYGTSHDLKAAAAEKFLLKTLPTALGAGARLTYTFAVSKFGGRNWTIVSTSLLLVPTVAAAVALQPGVSYDTLLVLAALAGVGGGNLGVAVVQLAGLAVLATAGREHPRVGIAGAVGAAGGVLVNIAFRQSFLASGTGDAAYIGFIAFYVICVCLTWLCYLRAATRRGLADVTSLSEPGAATAPPLRCSALSHLS